MFPHHYKTDFVATQTSLMKIGVDPRSLHGKSEILDENWYSVFTCPKPLPGNHKKVKSYHVKEQFAEQLVHHHWEVYQEGPWMYEIGHQFAKAFALENCEAAKEASDKKGYVIAWAQFAERAMKSSKERHNLANKCKKWEAAMNNRLNVGGLGASDPIHAGVPLRALGRSMQFDKMQLQEIIDMGTRADDRVKMEKQNLDSSKMVVEVAMHDLHYAEGRKSNNSMVNALQAKINVLKEDLERQRLISLITKLREEGQADLQSLELNVVRSKVSHFIHVWCLSCKNLSDM